MPRTSEPSPSPAGCYLFILSSSKGEIKSSGSLNDLLGASRWSERESMEPMLLPHRENVEPTLLSSQRECGALAAFLTLRTITFVCLLSAQPPAVGVPALASQVPLTSANPGCLSSLSRSFPVLLNLWVTTSSQAFISKKYLHHDS